MPEHFIEIAEYKIFTKTEGEGPPIILLHSYWGSQLLFDRLAKIFSVSRKVIRIDLPGHGNSGNPPHDYSFTSYAAVLNELLNRLDIREPVAVIGHSMGGYVAMAFAANFPERIAAMALMHSPVKGADIPGIKQREREERLLNKGKKDLLLQVIIPSNFAPGNSDILKEVVEILYLTGNQVSLEGAVRSIHAMNHRSNYLHMLKHAPYPLLVIIGKYDKVYNATDQLEDANLMPHAEVLFLHHSGHLGFLEEEGLVLHKLTDFFADSFEVKDKSSLNGSLT